MSTQENDSGLNGAGRTPEQEQMTRFGYYANMAAVGYPPAVATLLVKCGYSDPREVMRELSQWCYAKAMTPDSDSSPVLRGRDGCD